MLLKGAVIAVLDIESSLKGLLVKAAEASL